MATDMAAASWDLIFIAGPFLAGFHERRLVLLCACFLKHFEQLEDARE
jgi:hypothetical protein